MSKAFREADPENYLDYLEFDLLFDEEYDLYREIDINNILFQKEFEISDLTTYELDSEAEDIDKIEKILVEFLKRIEFIYHSNIKSNVTIEVNKNCINFLTE